MIVQQIKGIIQTYSNPPPIVKGPKRQRYYRLKKKYSVYQTQSSKLLYTNTDSPDPIKVLAKEGHRKENF